MILGSLSVNLRLLGIGGRVSSGMSSIYHVNVLVASAIAYRIEELPLNLVVGYLLAVLDLALDAVLKALALQFGHLLVGKCEHNCLLHQQLGLVHQT